MQSNTQVRSGKTGRLRPSLLSQQSLRLPALVTAHAPPPSSAPGAARYVSLAPSPQPCIPL
eukprot:1860170-Rhodomonas_salina.4